MLDPTLKWQICWQWSQFQVPKWPYLPMEWATTPCGLISDTKTISQGPHKILPESTGQWACRLYSWLWTLKWLSNTDPTPLSCGLMTNPVHKDLEWDSESLRLTWRPWFHRRSWNVLITPGLFICWSRASLTTQKPTVRHSYLHLCRKTSQSTYQT